MARPQRLWSGFHSLLDPSLPTHKFRSVDVHAMPEMLVSNNDEAEFEEVFPYVYKHWQTLVFGLEHLTQWLSTVEIDSTTGVKLIAIGSSMPRWSIVNHEKPLPICPDVMPKFPQSDWTLLGFDVANTWLDSRLFNPSDPLAKNKHLETYQSACNEYGLLNNYEVALLLAQDRDQMFHDHEFSQVFAVFEVPLRT